MSVILRLCSYTKSLYDFMILPLPLLVTNSLRAGSKAALIGVDWLFTWCINRLGRYVILCVLS